MYFRIEYYCEDYLLGWYVVDNHDFIVGGPYLSEEEANEAMELKEPVDLFL